MPTTGSDASIEALYQREWSGLVRLAWLLTRSREAAEDIVHEAFLRLDARPTPPDDPGPYLRRMVINGTQDHHRRVAIEKRHLPAPAQPTFIPEVDEIWEVLSRLPERQRRALVLRYYADLTLEQIADVLGCPLGTVKSLVHRGLARLREEVSQ